MAGLNLKPVKQFYRTASSYKKVFPRETATLPRGSGGGRQPSPRLGGIPVPGWGVSQSQVGGYPSPRQGRHPSPRWGLCPRVPWQGLCQDQGTPQERIWDQRQGHPSPCKRTWDQSLGHPSRKYVGPVEVLWDGDGVPLSVSRQTEKITSRST